MGLVALVVALPLTVILSDGGDEGDRRAGGGTGTALNPAVVADELGIEYRVPEGWRASRKRDPILLDAPDRTTRLAISALERAPASKRVLTDVLAATRRGYEDVEVRPGSGREVGGLPARGAVVHARNRKGTPLDILLAVMEGNRLTYLVESFTAEGAPAHRLVEAQLALNALRLRK